MYKHRQFLKSKKVFSDFEKFLILGTKKEVSLFSKLLSTNYDKLGSVGKFYHGIQTRGNNNALVPLEYEIEDHKKLIPILKGRDFNRYTKPKPSNKIIYKKENIKSGGNLDFHKKANKIIIRTTGDSIIATIDVDKNLVLNSVNIFFSEDEIYDNYNLLGILNSRLINFIYDIQVQELNKTFAEVKIVYLKNIPIPKRIQYSNLKKDIEEILINYSKDLDELINAKVYRLYDLVYDEVLIIEPRFNERMSKSEYEALEVE